MLKMLIFIGIGILLYSLFTLIKTKLKKRTNERIEIENV